MEDNQQRELPLEEQNKLKAAKTQELHDAEKERQEDGAAAREGIDVGSGDLSAARPPIPAGSGSFGTTPTFPNEPSEGYKHNPANMSNMLPPERQAPRPLDPSMVGQGRVKSHQQPVEKKTDEE